MISDPRRVVDDLEAKVVEEEGDIAASDDPPAPVPDGAIDTPGTEPTD